MTNAGSPRYARQRVLAGFGMGGQERLTDARVVVIGAGGLGSAVLPALAAAGVGTLVIVDDDTVDESNLARQTLHGIGDVGRPKVDSAADALRALTDHATVVTERTRFDRTTAPRIAAGADLLVDASDTPATRATADQAAADEGIPLVWGSALGYGGQAGVVWDARDVRYRDLFPTSDDAADSCEVVGVLPSVCTVIGGIMATEALKLVSGVGEPLLGAVLDFDARTGTMRRIDFVRDPAYVNPPAVDAAPLLVEELDAVALRAELDSPQPPLLVDVRESRLDPVPLLDDAVRADLDAIADDLGALPRDRRIVVVCQRGVRSRRALERLHEAGFTRAAHLTGGLESWDRA